MKRGWTLWLLCLALAGCSVFPARTLPSPTVTRAPVPTGSLPAVTATPLPTPTRSVKPDNTPTPSPESGLLSAPPSGPSAHRPAMAEAWVQDLDRLPAIPRYQISLTYNPEVRHIDGRVRIVATNRWSLPLSEVFLRLYPNGHAIFGNGQMTLSSVSDSVGAILPQAGADTSIMRVPLRQTWEPGRAITLTVEYSAQVPNGTGGGSSYGLFQEINGASILSDAFPMMAVFDGAQWHLDRMVDWGDPVFSEAALYEAEITVPSVYKVISSGVQVSSKDNSDGSATRLIRTGPVRELELVVSRRHEVLSARVGGVTINSYFYPDERVGGERALKAAVDSVSVFNRDFGEYPYSELDVVDAPITGVLGMEYPGLVLLTFQMYQDSDPWRLNITAAHEVAHQWWYGVVGNNIFGEPWLDEAMATFSSSVYTQLVNTQVFEGQLTDWENRHQQAVRQGTRGMITGSVQSFSGWWDYSPIVYYRGGQFFEALREELGDDAFFRGLRAYYEKMKYGIATGTDLRATFSVAAGRDLTMFYQKWLDTPQ
jgi:hypothetical protein